MEVKKSKQHQIAVETTKKANKKLHLIQLHTLTPDYPGDKRFCFMEVTEISGKEEESLRMSRIADNTYLKNTPFAVH
ncbi:uncharacterized protein LOC132707614 isoform X2 [Cylas formicarius]|uniref:uncharacterized protein LOC132707614 isoform X2 n=1 Tax=Cylas formicarius TaxID=197179 RepID=UPI0029583C0C|nr:uncharacterized protein LOC132707614 isoform X2 [Cylas formicarius]